MVKSKLSPGTSLAVWLSKKGARFWSTGKLIKNISRTAGKILPKKAWKKGRAQRLAAKELGFSRYTELMLSSQKLNHSSKIHGDQIVSIYFAFAFHFSFVTGLFFPDFIQKASNNPGLFYFEEVSLSAGIALLLTYFMLSGRLATTVHTAFKTANLEESNEDRWNSALEGNLFTQMKFYLSMTLIPLGRFPGVIKDGLTYSIQGESPLKVSASGPWRWDRRISKIAWGISLPLILLSFLESFGILQGLSDFFEPVDSFSNSGSHQWILRVTLPLAVISSLGKKLIGSGAYKCYVIDRDLEGWGTTRQSKAKRAFDMTPVKSQLIRGKER